MGDDTPETIALHWKAINNQWSDTEWITEFYCLAERLERDRDGLRSELVELKLQKKEWQDGRQEGRREALQIITSQCAEEALGDFTYDYSNGDSGDYSTGWQTEKLRMLLDCDESESIAERAEGAYYDHCGKAWDRELELERRIVELEKWSAVALAQLNLGVSLMPLEQLSRWEGIRGTLELYPDKDAGLKTSVPGEVEEVSRG